MQLVYNTPPVIVDNIGQMIDSMRSTGVITASNEISTGVYTIDSVNELNNDEYITIDSIDYKIESVTATTFNINAATGLDFIGLSWKSKAPYYQYGHIREIVKVISEKGKSKVLKYQKFPLIILPQDFEEDMQEMYSDATLDLIILNLTQPNYVAADRYENNFKPVLYPLYAKLKRAIDVSSYVDWVEPDHNKTDRLYWGNAGLYGNDGNIFNDWIDAVEINNLQLRFKNIC